MQFCTICKIIFLVGGPGKSNVVLEKSLENGCNFVYEPCRSARVTLPALWTCRVKKDEMCESYCNPLARVTLGAGSPSFRVNRALLLSGTVYSPGLSLRFQVAG